MTILHWGIGKQRDELRVKRKLLKDEVKLMGVGEGALRETSQ